MKRFGCIFLSLLILCSVFSCVGASAINFDCDVETFSDSILMVNLDSDMVVFEKDADTKRYPASLTKIMTFIVVAEYFDDYENTKIEVKRSVISNLQGSGIACSGLERHIGKKLSVKDLMYTMMIPVGHDAATVLSDHITKESGKNFITMMNDKAKELKLKGTHFSNPTGVHAADHYTTARDMYIMTKYAMGLPMFSKICSTATYYIEGDDTPFVTTNYMIDAGRGGEYFYTYAKGVKNGTTDEAGRCLVSTAMYNGYAYMVVCMHAPYNYEKDVTEQYCMIESANLYRWAFLNLEFVTQATTSTPICEQAVVNAWDTESVLLVPQTDLNVILPNDYNESDITIRPDNTKPVSAPIAKGQVITTGTVYYKDQPFTKVTLVSQDEVKVSFMLYFTDLVKSILTSIWFLIAVLIVVVLFVIFVGVSSSYNKKKKERTKRKYK